jgi:hypothetical protein
VAVFSQFLHGLGQEFFVFLVIGDDKSVEDVPVDFTDVAAVVDFLPLHGFGPIEDPAVAEEGEDSNSDEYEGLGSEVEGQEDANFLIEHWQDEWSCEHHDPSHDVNPGNQQLVLIIVPEIFHIHGGCWF